MIREILDAHEADERKQTYLHDARAEAWKIVTARGVVNVNMIREAIGDPPAGVDPRLMGAVLRREAGFVPVGYSRGTRATSHNRPVMNWTVA